MTNTLDDVLSGPITISGILFQYVRPIIEQYLKNGTVRSIERCYDATTLHQLQHASAHAITLAIQQALPAFYDAQNLFNGRIRPKNKSTLDKSTLDKSTLDKSTFRTKQEFYEAYTAFARSLLDRTAHGNLDAMTLDALKKMVGFDAVKAGMRLDKPLWLGMVTGDTALTSQYPVVLEVARLKHPARIGAKYARYVCEGILEAKDFGTLEQKDLKKIERQGLSRKAMEAFGSMHTAGLRTPFNLEDAGFDIMSYLFFRSQITDVLGVTYVAQIRELAKQLLGDLQADTRLGIQRRYPLHLATGFALREHKQRNRYSYSYIEAYCIDDHIALPKEHKDPQRPTGNNNIFATVVPNQSSSTHQIKVDVGLYGLAAYAVDRIGGAGSHTRYEARKETEKGKWPRKLQQLDQAIAHAISDLMIHVDISQFPLFEGVAL